MEDLMSFYRVPTEVATLIYQYVHQLKMCDVLQRDAKFSVICLGRSLSYDRKWTIRNYAEDTWHRIPRYYDVESGRMRGWYWHGHPIGVRL